MKQHIQSVEAYYKSNTDVIDFLAESKEFSYKSWAEGSSAKVIVLAAAGALEVELCDVVESFFTGEQKRHEVTVAIVKRKAISRQFHTWFDWDNGKAASFYALFGNGFKTFVSQVISKEVNFLVYEKAFLEIGQKRNSIVHNGFCSSTCEWTHAEAMDRFREGTKYCEAIGEALRRYCE